MMNVLLGFTERHCNTLGHVCEHPPNNNNANLIARYGIVGAFLLKIMFQKLFFPNLIGVLLLMWP